MLNVHILLILHLYILLNLLIIIFLLLLVLLFVLLLHLYHNVRILSFYILMLSVYLLLQKNTTKLENLLLIGYGPTYVAMPYQMLTIGLNVLVLLVSIALVYCLRTSYLEVIERIYPTLETGSPIWTLFIGFMLFVIVSLVNVWAIRKKIASLA